MKDENTLRSEGIKQALAPVVESTVQSLVPLAVGFLTQWLHNLLTKHADNQKEVKNAP